MKGAAKRCIDILAEEGLTVVSYRQNRHFVFRCALPGMDGVAIIVASVSPSDHRNELNLRRDARTARSTLISRKGSR